MGKSSSKAKNVLINKIVCLAGRKYCDQGQRVKQVGEEEGGGEGVRKGRNGV